MGVGGNSTSLHVPNLKHGHLYTSTFDELFGATLNVNKESPCEEAAPCSRPAARCRQENSPTMGQTQSGNGSSGKRHAIDPAHLLPRQLPLNSQCAHRMQSGFRGMPSKPCVRARDA